MKEKARENRIDKTRTKAEFLLQLHRQEEKQRNASKSIPHARAAVTTATSSERTLPLGMGCR